MSHLGVEHRRHARKYGIYFKGTLIKTI